MRFIVAVAIGLAFLCLSGCAQHKGSDTLSGVDPEQARRINADNGRFEKAEDPPLTATTHFAAAQLAEAQGNLPLAVEQYQRAVKLDPKHAPSLFRLGVLHAQLKQYPQAITTWREYIEAANGSATGYSNLGFCQELAGQPEAAEAAYRKGIEADPRNRPCRVNYGLMLARRGRTAEALRHFQAVLTEAEAHYNLASTYEQQGQRQQARAEYQKALELDPNLADARGRLAGLGE